MNTISSDKLKEQFLDYISQFDHIVCVGAGNCFEEIAFLYQHTEIEKKIICCIDNSKKKIGTIVYFGRKKIPVYHFSDIKDFNKKKDLILITIINYIPVLEEIKELIAPEHVFVYRFIRAMIYDTAASEKKIPSSINIASTSMIPKKIHFCWFGNNPIPDRYLAWMETWKKYCPDYEIIRWDESNYDITKNKYMLEAYQQKKWAFVPDYARLDIIYNHGGIYLDTDVKILKSFDDLLFLEGFAGFESEHYVALGLGFGARKKMPIIKVMRDAYDNLRFIRNDGHLNLTPSPKYQTNTLMQLGLIGNGEYQVVKGMTIFPEKMFSAKSIFTRQVKTCTYSHSIHHYDASWVDQSIREQNKYFEQEMKKFIKNWKKQFR